MKYWEEFSEPVFTFPHEEYEYAFDSVFKITDDNITSDSPIETRIWRITNRVCIMNNIPVNKLLSKTRKREVVETRQIIFKLCYELVSGASLSVIGEAFRFDEKPNGFDHATVLHGIRTMTNLIETNKKYNNIYNKIKMRIIAHEEV